MCQCSHQQARGPSAKGLMAVIVIIAGLMVGAGMNPAKGSGKGLTLAEVFGGGLRLPQITAPSTSARDLLQNKRLTLTPQARRDLQRGVVDRDLINILGRLLQRHRLAVSVFKTGHTKYVAGTSRVSNHWSGRGADIWKVDGGRVRPGHRPSLAVARELARMRTAEVGSPFGHLGPGFFTDGAHLDHIHIGVR